MKVIWVPLAPSSGAWRNAGWKRSRPSAGKTWTWCSTRRPALRLRVPPGGISALTPDALGADRCFNNHDDGPGPATSDLRDRVRGERRVRYLHGSITRAVPHDQGFGSIPVDSGDRFDATSPAE